MKCVGGEGVPSKRGGVAPASRLCLPDDAKFKTYKQALLAGLDISNDGDKTRLRGGVEVRAEMNQSQLIAFKFAFTCDIYFKKYILYPPWDATNTHL